MHQLIFAAVGTVLTVLWGFGFSIIADKFEYRYRWRPDSIMAALWIMGQFAIVFAAVSLGGGNV